MLLRSCNHCLVCGFLPDFLSGLPYIEYFLSIVNNEELLRGMDGGTEQDTSMYLILLQHPPGTRLHYEEFSARFTKVIHCPLPSSLHSSCLLELSQIVSCGWPCTP